MVGTRSSLSIRSTSVPSPTKGCLRLSRHLLRDGGCCGAVGPWAGPSPLRRPKKAVVTARVPSRSAGTMSSTLGSDSAWVPRPNRGDDADARIGCGPALPTHGCPGPTRVRLEADPRPPSERSELGAGPVRRAGPHAAGQEQGGPQRELPPRHPIADQVPRPAGHSSATPLRNHPGLHLDPFLLRSHCSRHDPERLILIVAGVSS